MEKGETALYPCLLYLCNGSKRIILLYEKICFDRHLIY